MNDIETQANIIQEAIKELEGRLPYKTLSDSLVQASIWEIRTAVGTLRKIAAQSSSS
jgi:hypothetical protein